MTYSNETGPWEHDGSIRRLSERGDSSQERQNGPVGPCGVVTRFLETKPPNLPVLWGFLSTIQRTEKRTPDGEIVHIVPDRVHLTTRLW